MDFSERMLAIRESISAKLGDRWSMVGPVFGPLPSLTDEDPHALGGRQSFVPALGEIVWELPVDVAARVPLSAHICRLSDGMLIGYLRVPHYFEHRVLDEFAALIAHFESNTTAMVFDQVNNLGGDMFLMYAILSHLTDRPLAVPKHQIRINEDDVSIAQEMLAIAEAGELGTIPPEEIAYHRKVLSEFRAGRGTTLEKLTNPLHLCGVAEVLPAEVHYTKSIVVLINELTFSSPEFLAAILQDNRRATLFGHRTAGAGGCMKTIPLGELGVRDMSVRWTLAWRKNGQPIEKRGVQPDVRYKLTVEDLQTGYAGYRQALLATINALKSPSI